jgi:hypothetical protein
MAKKGRGLFLLPLLVAARALAGPPSTTAAPDYAQIGTPDQSAGRIAIEQFRHAGISGPYYLEFVLRVLPRRGAERSVRGRLWGDRNEQGPLLRIVLDPGAADERRWLMQGGPQAGVWRRDGQGVTRPAELLEPLWDGSEITVFDLEMPFLYWPDETLLSVNRIRGRPANAFRFRPPAAFTVQHPAISGVLAYFDTEYNAPVQTELLDLTGRPLKTWILADLKKVGETWIPREFDVRNELTRDKTRLDVTGAALNVPLLPALFEPDGLGDDIAAPGRVVQFGE